MIRFLFNGKAERLVAFCFAPMALVLLFPFLGFYGERDALGPFIFLVVLIMASLFYWVSIRVILRLLHHDVKRLSGYSRINLVTHSILNLAMIWSCWLYPLETDPMGFLYVVLVCYVISAILRLQKIAQLIVCVESKQKVGWREYWPTLFLLIFPVLGVWELHSRLRKFII